MTLVQEVKRIAQEAGKAILAVYQQDFDVEVKEDDSPLTQADLASHKCIVQGLEALSPEVPILSEESEALAYAERKTWSKFWLVDPLDGTKEFVKRNGEFTVNIALVEDQRPVLGVVYLPVQGICYWAAEGLGAHRTEGKVSQALVAREAVPDTLKVAASRSHSGPETETFLANMAKDFELQLLSKGSALKLCLVAEGEADLYPRLGPTMEWDTAAAQCVVEQAGAAVTTLEGEPLLYNKENLRNPFFMVASSALSSLWQQYLPQDL